MTCDLERLDENTLVCKLCGRKIKSRLDPNNVHAQCRTKQPEKPKRIRRGCGCGKARLARLRQLSKNSLNRHLPAQQKTSQNPGPDRGAEPLAETPTI